LVGNSTAIEDFKRNNTMSLHDKPEYNEPELVSALKEHRLSATLPSQMSDAFRCGWKAQKTFMLGWAIGRWHEEVKNRPLENVHRRSLDDCWRQVIRQLGGDPEALLGPDHGHLKVLAAYPAVRRVEKVRKFRDIVVGSTVRFSFGGVDNAVGKKIDGSTVRVNKLNSTGTVDVKIKPDLNEDDFTIIEELT
jgi:hypothetical protein